MKNETKILEKLTRPHKITLYKNGENPNIYYYFSYNKRVFRGSTGTTNLEKSIDTVTDIFVGVKHGKDPKSQKVEYIKFEDVVKKFLAHKTLQGLSEQTLSGYKRQTVLLSEKFKGKSIESITAQSYLDYTDWRLNYYKSHPEKNTQHYKRKGKTLTGRKFTKAGIVSVNRECALLVSILRFAKSNLNAFQGKDIHPYKKNQEHPRDEILTKQEYEKLKKYWMKRNPYYWSIISFTNNTGIRYPSELNKIQYRDVNLDKSFVIIRDRKNKGTDTLNSCVPLVGTAKLIIENLKKRKSVSSNDNDFVFVNDKGKQIKNIRKAFKNSLKACNINKNLSMYSLRHLFTTRMVKRSDIPLKSLALVLGHKDTKMLDKVYSHLRSEELVSIFQNSENNKKAHIEKMKKELEELEGQAE